MRKLSKHISLQKYLVFLVIPAKAGIHFLLKYRSSVFTAITVCLLFRNIVLIIFLLSAFVSLAQNDKVKVFNNLKDRFSKIESLEIDFEFADNPDITGLVLAKKGDKYVMDFTGRKIVCDGNTIWNISKIDSNVVISTFDKEHTDISIEQFFFNSLENYKPIDLVKESSTAAGTSLVLTLAPAKGDNGLIRIWMQPNSGRVSAVGFVAGDMEQVWKINKLIINPKFNDRMFSYKISDDVEVIDLR